MAKVAEVTNELGTLAKQIGGLDISAVAERDPYINALIYGDPGVGKTVLTGSASAVVVMAPVLVIDVEGGTFSLRDRYSDVDVVRVKRWIDIQNIYGALFDQAKNGVLEYNTLVLDSLSEIQKFSMEQIMAEVVKGDPERDRDVPSVREWGKNLEQIRRLVRAFRDLPLNCLFTALAMNDKDQRSGLITTRPSLSGKMGAEVAGFVDLVSYMYTKIKDGKIERYLLNQPTDRQVAKDRSGRLPLVLQDPTMQSIHDFIFGDAVPDSVPIDDVAPAGDLQSLVETSNGNDEKTNTTQETGDK